MEGCPIDARAVGIAHFDRTERRLQLLGERKRKLAGAVGTRFNAWLGMVEKCVSRGDGTTSGKRAEIAKVNIRMVLASQKVILRGAAEVPRTAVVLRRRECVEIQMQLPSTRHRCRCRG